MSSAESAPTRRQRGRPHVQCNVLTVLDGQQNISEEAEAIQSFLRGCASVFGEDLFELDSQVVDHLAALSHASQRFLDQEMMECGMGMRQEDLGQEGQEDGQLVQAMNEFAIQQRFDPEQHPVAVCVMVSIWSSDESKAEPNRREVLWSFDQVVHCVKKILEQAQGIMPSSAAQVVEESVMSAASEEPSKCHQDDQKAMDQDVPTNQQPIRLFLAGDRSQVGKSTLCLGLLGSLLQMGFRPHELGYIKPATQCEQPQLVGKFCRAIGIECCEIGPIVFYSGFTRAFLKGETLDSTELLQQARKRVDEISKDKQIVIVDGVGYPAVGSICGVSNAQMAKELGAHVVLIGRNGVGDAVDSFNLNATFFTFHGVRVLGGIFNKFACKGFYSLRNCKPSIEQYFEQFAPQFKAYGLVPDLFEENEVGDDDDMAVEEDDDDDAGDEAATEASSGTTISSSSSRSTRRSRGGHGGAESGDFIAMDRDLKRRRGCGGHEEYDLANIGHLTLEEAQLAYRVIDSVRQHVNVEQILTDAKSISPFLPATGQVNNASTMQQANDSKRPLDGQRPSSTSTFKKTRQEIQQQASTLGAPGG